MENSESPTWNWTTYKQVPEGATVIAPGNGYIWRNRQQAEDEASNPGARRTMVAYGKVDGLTAATLRTDDGSEVHEFRPGAKRVLWSA